jgi:hypothetical protein
MDLRFEARHLALVLAGVQRHVGAVEADAGYVSSTCTVTISSA